MLAATLALVMAVAEAVAEIEIPVEDMLGVTEALELTGDEAAELEIGLLVAELEAGVDAREVVAEDELTGVEGLPEETGKELGEEDEVTRLLEARIDDTALEDPAGEETGLLGGREEELMTELEGNDELTADELKEVATDELETAVLLREAEGEEIE